MRWLRCKFSLNKRNQNYIDKSHDSYSSGDWLKTVSGCMSKDGRFKLCNSMGFCTSQAMGMLTNSFFQVSSVLIQTDLTFAQWLKSIVGGNRTQTYTFGLITLQDGQHSHCRLCLMMERTVSPFSYHPMENKPLWCRAELTDCWSKVVMDAGTWRRFWLNHPRTNRGTISTQQPCAWTMISPHVQSFLVRLKQTTFSSLQSHF